MLSGERISNWFRSSRDVQLRAFISAIPRTGERLRIIEHVGLWWDMQDFGRKVRRIAPAYFVQTFNYWFPVDPHFRRLPFVHWMPRPLRARLMQWLPLATGGRARDIGTAYRFVNRARLLGKTQMRYLFPDARMAAERVMLLAKSYTAIRHPAVSPAS